MRRHFLAMAGLVLLTNLGCSSSALTVEDASQAAYSFTLRNIGTQELRQLRVQTGENVPPVTVASLTAGAETQRYVVSALHESPVVSAEINGQVRTFTPVEGFSGFNPAKAPGRYRITLKYEPQYAIIDVRVEPMP